MRAARHSACGAWWPAINPLPPLARAGVALGAHPGTPDGTPRQIFYATVSGLNVTFTLVTPLPEEQIPSTFCGERSFPSPDKAEEAAHDFNNGFFSVSDGTPLLSSRLDALGTLRAVQARRHTAADGQPIRVTRTAIRRGSAA